MSERNFCERCGKRIAGNEWDIHTCTPPAPKRPQNCGTGHCSCIECVMEPAQPQQELIDTDGENRAVRMFLALYGGACGITTDKMRKHLEMAGFSGAWPEWANQNMHLTKAGAQLWIRHLFALEQPPQRKPLHIGDETAAFKAWFDAWWIGDGEQGETIPTQTDKHFLTYLDQYTLGFGAWMAAKHAAQGITGDAA